MLAVTREQNDQDLYNSPMATPKLISIELPFFTHIVQNSCQALPAALVYLQLP